MKAIKSGKQRRAEIKAAREKRRADLHRAAAPQARRPWGTVPVGALLAQMQDAYRAPLFVQRGYYEDKPFRCVDCGAECVWTAERQRWWYETARGDFRTTARRCAPCRAKERARKEAARRASQEGLERKAERLAKLAAQG